MEIPQMAANNGRIAALTIILQKKYLVEVRKKILATYIVSKEFSLGRLQMNSFVHKGNTLKGTERNVCYKH
jgi:hypothetical protein